MKQYRHIAYILLTLLLMGSVANEAWATKVTYHILTLPIDPSRYDYKMQAAFTGKRLEAFSVIDNKIVIFNQLSFIISILIQDNTSQRIYWRDPERNLS